MAKQPTPASGGFVPFSAPVVDPPADFVPFSAPIVPADPSEPAEPAQKSATAEKKEG